MKFIKQKIDNYINNRVDRYYRSKKDSDDFFKRMEKAEKQLKNIMKNNSREKSNEYKKGVKDALKSVLYNVDNIHLKSKFIGNIESNITYGDIYNAFNIHVKNLAKNKFNIEL
jgi:hypothetical protein